MTQGRDDISLEDDDESALPWGDEDDDATTATATADVERTDAPGPPIVTRAIPVPDEPNEITEAMWVPDGDDAPEPARRRRRVGSTRR